MHICTNICAFSPRLSAEHHCLLDGQFIVLEWKLAPRLSLDQQPVVPLAIVAIIWVTLRRNPLF